MNHDFESLMECNERESDQATGNTLPKSPKSCDIGPKKKKCGADTVLGSPGNSIYLLKIIWFLNLFLAALGLCCCARAFCSCGEWGLLFVALRGLHIAVASLVVEHGL